jgi:eukaryotic-like serine/threonine-protein kinase
MSRTGKLILNIVILLALLIALTWLMDSIIMPRYTRSGVGEPLPDVQNLSLLDAEKQLADLQLQPVVDNRRSSLLPAGIVIYQTPQPGIEVKPGRRIHLTVSLGRASLIVPQLIGRSSRQAEVALHDAGLPDGQLRLITAFDDFAPRGVIIDQSVTSGDSLKLDDTLTITVSMGPAVDSVKVPEILRNSEAEARRQLLLHGLSVGEIDYRYYASVAPDQVLRCEPEPGSYLQPFGEVSLLITAERDTL